MQNIDIFLNMCIMFVFSVKFWAMNDENSFTREWDELQLIIYFIETGLVPRLGIFKVTAALFLYASVDVDVRPSNQ